VAGCLLRRAVLWSTSDVVAVLAAVNKEWAIVIPWVEAQLVGQVPMAVPLDHREKVQGRSLVVRLHSI
jgi:hypothetical protein